MVEGPEQSCMLGTTMRHDLPTQVNGMLDSPDRAPVPTFPACDNPQHDPGGAFERLLQGRLHDPFSLLGLHPDGMKWVVRVYEPRAREMRLLSAQAGGAAADAGELLACRDRRGLFEWHGSTAPAQPYRLRATFDNGTQREWRDPYSSAPQISDDELYLFNEGRLTQAWRTLGCTPAPAGAAPGYRFPASVSAIQSAM